MSQYAGETRVRTAIPWPLAAMPGYTIGFVAPVPFLYAALKLQTRKLWLIAAAYGAVWILAWALTAGTPEDSESSTVGVILFLALAVGGTTHAFVLRRSLPPGPGGHVGTIGQPAVHAPIAATVGDPAQATCAQLQAALSALNSRVTAHAQWFPPTCKQLLDETMAQMKAVLAFIANNGHADAELRSVEAMLTDYLPTSIDTYMRLPREYAVSQRNPDGRTAAEELELQLRLLRDGAKEAAASLYRGDALRLEQQSAFLQAKFGSSELDLDG